MAIFVFLQSCCLSGVLAYWFPHARIRSKSATLRKWRKKLKGLEALLIEHMKMEGHSKVRVSDTGRWHTFELGDTLSHSEKPKRFLSDSEAA